MSDSNAEDINFLVDVLYTGHYATLFTDIELEVIIVFSSAQKIWDFLMGDFLSYVMLNLKAGAHKLCSLATIIR